MTTLYEAVGNFLAPIMAEGGSIVEEWPDDTTVEIKFGCCEVTMQLKELKALDDAHSAAMLAKEARAKRKAKGSLL